MNFNRLLATFLIGLIFVITACGGGSSGGTSSVDDTDTETAAKFTDVNQIISTNCLSCHGSTTTNGAPMSLTTFSQVSFFATSIAERINLPESNSQMMPKNGTKLSSTDIDKVESWIAAGKLNN